MWGSFVCSANIFPIRAVPPLAKDGIQGFQGGSHYSCVGPHASRIGNWSVSQLGGW